jgi:hypothetical protein
LVPVPIPILVLVLVLVLFPVPSSGLASIVELAQLHVTNAFPRIGNVRFAWLALDSKSWTSLQRDLGQRTDDIIYMGQFLARTRGHWGSEAKKSWGA